MAKKQISDLGNLTGKKVLVRRYDAATLDDKIEVQNGLTARAYLVYHVA